jgi:Protein of unknown function (DUF3102)
MSIENNTAPASPQAGLAAIARRIRDEHQASARAFANALSHALNAGDGLIEAQNLVPANRWGQWLRNYCSMGSSTARLFMQLARERQTIEAEISRVPDLSLRAARRLIATPKPKPRPAGTQQGPRQAAAGGKLARTVTGALRQALSLQKDAPTGEIAPGVANALNGILSRLQSAGLTLHDINIGIRAPGAKHTRRAA